MKKGWQRAALAGAAAVVVVAVATAQEAPVRIELRSGERVEGDLVEFGEHVSRVRSGGAVREPTSTLFAKIRWPGTAPGAEPETVWEKEPAPFTPGAK